jgi:nifR3 family TIM-barrel protein
MQPPLTSPFRIGDVEIANRVLLAPLAGIGNWFVRLQARRHGAGLAVSEMVSSFGIHYRNERTLRELLRLHPDEHPVSVQLFGQDPEVMRSAAAVVSEAGADLIDINMGCPVKKVCKTGAGAALLADPELAVRIVTAAREGGGLPVTVKVRSGLARGGREGFDLAIRLAEEAGISAVGFHPRSAATQHKGTPDYPLARELVDRISIPVVISGGLDSAEGARHAYEASGADAVMIARGSLGNPWIFEELTGDRVAAPGRDEVIAELLWVMDRAERSSTWDRSEPPGSCASSIPGTWSAWAPTTSPPPRCRYATIWKGLVAWSRDSRSAPCWLHSDRIGSVVDRAGWAWCSVSNSRKWETYMMKKSSARLALLACASVASLGLLAGASPAAAKTKTATFNQCVNIGQAIPEVATGPQSSRAFSIPVTVPKFKGKPQDGAVTAFGSAGVRITHTNDNDLQLSLVSPGGRLSTLANRRGASGDGYGTGSNSCAGSLVQFSDTAATSIVTPGNTANNPITGSFRPESPLSTFIGGPARGFWTLIVTDTSTPNVGSLDAASLNFTYQYKVKPKKKKK